MSRCCKDYYCEECCCSPCCCKKVKCVKRRRARGRRRPTSILPLLAGVLFVLALRNNGSPGDNRNVNIIKIGNEDEYECECETKCESRCKC